MLYFLINRDTFPCAGADRVVGRRPGGRQLWLCLPSSGTAETKRGIERPPQVLGDE